MSHTIMIVDDSAIIRLQLSSALKKNGYQVVEAVNGADALNLAQQRNDIALVITDINMPVMDGLTFLAQLRALDGYDALPIFVLTTESTDHIQDEGREKGATAWVVKPFDEAALMAGIRNCLEPSELAGA